MPDWGDMLYLTESVTVFHCDNSALRCSADRVTRHKRDQTRACKTANMNTYMNANTRTRTETHRYKHTNTHTHTHKNTRHVTHISYSPCFRAYCMLNDELSHLARSGVRSFILNRAQDLGHWSKLEGMKMYTRMCVCENTHKRTHKHKHTHTHTDTHTQTQTQTHRHRHTHTHTHAHTHLVQARGQSEGHKHAELRHSVAVAGCDTYTKAVLILGAGASPPLENVKHTVKMYVLKPR